MLPPRAKMAQLPQGAEPLPNRAGAAPGVLLTHQGVTIVALPGVPAEMKDIFSHSLLPRLDAIFPEQTYAERTLKTKVWDESILAPAVDAVAAPTSSRLCQVARPGLRLRHGRFRHAGGPGKDEAEVTALLDAAEADLRGELARLGIDVE